MLDQIKEALLKLDPNNDDHWTREGVPRLDVMKELLGADVSRADITQASSSFTRKTPTLEEAADNDGNETPETKQPEATDTKEDPADEAETPEAEVKATEEEEIEAELEKARDKLNKAQKRFAKAQTEMDVVISARAKRDARTTDAHTIQAFQKSQFKARQQKAARKKRLDELLG